ncbi:hypothetical protein [Clostridium mediterraneense]|uniref:hypothetical protein n=1 Tax=Clostridium mediterraneense TaxID=1805472 RepID=UPI0008352A81|nr:hypothetical protein [Clostridium mediterraneense]
MANHDLKEKNSIFKKLILQYSLIVSIVMISIYILFFNVSHNYPNKFNTQTVLTWYFPQIIFAFIIAFTLLGICSLLIVNHNISSLKDFLSLKNSIIILLMFIVISICHYSLSLLQTSISIAENLMYAFDIFSALFIVLFIFIGVLSLTILKSLSKK